MATKFVKIRGRIVPISDKKDRNKKQNKKSNDQYVSVVERESNLQAAKSVGFRAASLGAAIGGIGGAVFGLSRALGGTPREYARMISAGAGIGATGLGLKLGIIGTAAGFVAGGGYRVAVRKKASRK